jgi:hypothetical protein
MKRPNIYVPMAALILTAALAVPSAALQQVPFKGAFQGQDCFPIQNTGCSAVNSPAIDTSGTGIGTHVGDIPGASFMGATAINPQDDIVGRYISSFDDKFQGFRLKLECASLCRN